MGIHKSHSILPGRLLHILVFAFLVLGIQGHYLPGVAPHDYAKGDPVSLYVNALSSSETLLPYDYYHPRLRFCRPDEIKPQPESLGGILFGDRLVNSRFEVGTCC